MLKKKKDNKLKKKITVIFNVPFKLMHFGAGSVDLKNR